MPDQKTMLRRRDAAAALTAAGYQIAPATLSTMATRGNGPPYRRFSGRAIYAWDDLLAWAEARTTPPRRSTSESDAA